MSLLAGEAGGVAAHLQCSLCGHFSKSHAHQLAHMATSHPCYLDNVAVGRLGNIMLYQSTARLFHCSACFYTTKDFTKLYKHLISRHCEDQRGEEEEDEGIGGALMEIFRRRRSIQEMAQKKEEELQKEKVEVQKKEVMLGGEEVQKEVEVQKDVLEEKEVQKEVQKEVEVQKDVQEEKEVQKEVEVQKNIQEEKEVQKDVTSGSEVVQKAEEVQMDVQKGDEEVQMEVAQKAEEVVQQEVQKESALGNQSVLMFDGAGYHCLICGWKSRLKAVGINHVVRKHDIPKAYAAQAIRQDGAAMAKLAGGGVDEDGLTTELSGELLKEEVEATAKVVQFISNRFVCLLCGWKAKLKGFAISHVVRCHDVERPYVCRDCPRSFFLPSRLLQHLRSTHRPGRYACPFCCFRSSVMGGFRRHCSRCSSRDGDGGVVVTGGGGAAAGEEVMEDDEEEEEEQEEEKKESRGARKRKRTERLMMMDEEEEDDDED